MSDLDLISIIAKVIVMSIVVKALVIGSDFSFHHWMKDGKKYTEWYSNRSKYKS